MRLETLYFKIIFKRLFKRESPRNISQSNPLPAFCQIESGIEVSKKQWENISCFHKQSLYLVKNSIAFDCRMFIFV